MAAQRESIFKAITAYLGEDQSAKYPNINWESQADLMALKFLSKTEKFGFDASSLYNSAPELLPVNNAKTLNKLLSEKPIVHEQKQATETFTPVNNF